MRSYWDLPGEYDFLYSGPDWLQVLLSNCNLKQRDRVLLLLWRSWHLRCNITHGKGDETIANSVAFLQSYCDIVHNEVDNDKEKGNRTDDSFIKTNDVSAINGKALVKEIIRWQPPPMGAIKVNVDASYCHVSGEAAVGAVVRNHQGQIVVASSKVIEKCQDPEEAEACAILEGLMLAIDNNLEPNSVESDCTNAVSNVHRNTGKHSRAWVVYNNIESISLLIPACKVVKIGRTANRVAHDIAALARKSGESKVWMDPIPPDIQEIAVKDFVSLPLSNI
ncbi:hypothetical protein ACQ4PT_023336 [Festuca glaucescens]